MTKSATRVASSVAASERAGVVCDDEIDALRGRGSRRRTGWALGVGNDGNFREAAIVPAARGRRDVDVNHRPVCPVASASTARRSASDVFPRSALSSRGSQHAHANSTARALYMANCSWLYSGIFLYIDTASPCGRTSGGREAGTSPPIPTRVSRPAFSSTEGVPSAAGTGSPRRPWY